MDIKYDVPAPPAGALERTISLGQRKMRSMRLAKMPLGRLLGLQLAHFSSLYWAVQFVVIVCILLSTGSGKESARFAVLVYAGAANALGCPELLRDILGRKVITSFPPRETVICLAFYVHYGCSMHEVLRKRLESGK